MAIILKLVKGARELDLNSGRYCIDQNFRPPTAQDAERGWSFGLHIKSANLGAASEVHQAFSDIAAMLSMTGDSAEPLQLWYKADDTIPFEPIFGTVGRFSRYNITRGELQAGRQYGLADLRSKVVPQCVITLTIEPAAEGNRQAIGRAYGGVYQDFIGGERGQSKGVIVAPAATNLFTNPVFGNSTWDTGWSVGTGTDEATKTANYDRDFVLFGSTSAKVFGIDDGGTFYQSITLTATTYTVSVYAKLPSGEAITSNTYCGIHYNGTDSTATWVSVGNGWYRGYKTITGTGGAANLGVWTTIGVTVYYDAFQVEIGGDMTAFFYGDLPGCAWSGTRHASSSTRAAGGYTINAADIDKSTFTAIIGWRIPAGTTQSGTDYLLDTNEGANAMSIYYDSGNIVFRNHAETASIAVSHTDDAFVFIHAYGFGFSSGMYINGSTFLATSGAPTPNNQPTTIYLGSDNAAANHCEGDIVYFGWYNTRLSVAQVAQSYKEIYSAIYNSDPGLLQSPGVPYIWTAGNDFTIDQAQDGTYDGYAILSGMPGDLPPETEYRITATRASTTAYNVFTGITPIDYPDIAKITDLKLYDDKSGVVDANASGGEYESVSVTSASTWASSTAATTFDRPWTIKGPVHVFARLRAATGGVVLRARIALGASSTPGVYSYPIAITTNTSYRWYYIGTLTLQQFEFLERQNQRASGRVQFTKTDTNETVYLDLVTYVVGTLQYQPGAASSAATSKVFILKNQDAAICAASTTTPIDLYTMRGNYARPEPNRYNILNMWLAADGGAHVITETVAFDSLYITPRWRIV